jgi:hypothetical protein
LGAERGRNPKRIWFSAISFEISEDDKGALMGERFGLSDVDSENENKDIASEDTLL